IRIGASFAKQELMGCLALHRPPEGKPFPAGFVHLPDDVTEDQVKQLTSEELVTAVKRGRTRREWVPIGGRRNEVLDCANYARGLAAMRGWDRWREVHWRDLKGALGIERSRPAITLDDGVPEKTVAAGSLAARNLQRAGSRRSKVRSRTR
ncbi:terminase gpA endonuclease subunit, partial [Methylobacterium sp. J-068]|uniref:terminase gpA endonuclease subunit n=1 Tax=Methylobacterium sp. J-068 TaxID=2836649 RepID=UPI001FBB8C0E